MPIYIMLNDHNNPYIESTTVLSDKGWGEGDLQSLTFQPSLEEAYESSARKINNVI